MRGRGPERKKSREGRKDVKRESDEGKRQKMERRESEGEEAREFAGREMEGRGFGKD